MEVRQNRGELQLMKRVFTQCQVSTAAEQCVSVGVNAYISLNVSM